MIDIILATYNDENSISSSIESILNQSFTNFNLIIINDGSTDSTPNIIQRYANRDSRVKIYTNSKNLGLPLSLNKGIELCNSDFIGRADGDDIWMPDKLQKQMNFIKENNDINILGTGAILNDKSRSKIFFRKEINFRNKGIKLLINDYLFHSSVIFRSFILKENKYDEKLLRSQDKFLWLTLLDKGYKIYNIQEALIIYNYEFKSSFKSIYNRFKTDLIISFRYKSFFAIIFSIFIFLKKLIFKFLGK